MDDETIRTIMDILKRGNDVQIQRKGEGYIVLEVKKTIKIRQDNKNLPLGQGEIRSATCRS